MNCLLTIFGKLRARRVGCNRRWGGNRGGVLRRHIKLLAVRRDGGGGNPLREAFVIDEGDVERAEAVSAAGRVEVFAAGLYLPDFALSKRMVDVVCHIARRVV